MEENKTLTENKTAKPEKATKKKIEHSFMANSKYFTICIYALLTVSLCTVIIYSIVNFETTKANFKFLLSTLSPFLVAIFIALLLNPIVVTLDKKFFPRIFHGKFRRLSKFLSILLAYVVAAGLIAIMVLYVVPELGRSIADLGPTLRKIVDAVIHFLENIDQIYPQLDVEWIESRINELIPNLISYGTSLVSNLVPLLYSLSMSIVNAAVDLLLAVVVSCYLLTDKERLARGAKRITYALLPTDVVEEFIAIARECMSIFTGFITGKTLDSLIIGILCFILMSIFKMPYALLISVIVGVTNMIPYFGPFIGAIPSAILLIFIDFPKAVGFGIMIFCLQQFDGLYLGPKILGKNTGLKPLWVIFAITIGGAYGGLLGMFLGVPLVASIFYVLDNSLRKRLARKNIPDEF